MEHYNGIQLELPSDLEIEECTSCHEQFIDEATAERIDTALEAAYQGAQASDVLNAAREGMQRFPGALKALGET